MSSLTTIRTNAAIAILSALLCLVLSLTNMLWLAGFVMIMGILTPQRHMRALTFIIAGVALAGAFIWPIAALMQLFYIINLVCVVGLCWQAIDFVSAHDARADAHCSAALKRLTHNES